MTTPEDTSTTPVSDAPEATDAPFMRTIKTYVLRAGRMGPGQTRAFEQFGPKFLVPYSAERLDVQASFGRSAPLILEIGFGMGDATAKIAQVRPDDNFLCCEVHEPGVGALLKRCGEESIANIRIVQHDAIEVMDNMLGENSLDGVHIFFPDPWHKSRHHKRRLIQSPFIQRLARHIKPGGYLHLATDWQPYSEQMMAVLRAEALLVNTSDAADGFAAKPDYRPLTKFENRGLKLGHGVWDLVFRRV
ncbi:tRNA (guanosine(46)-N7)-methyltransferase TrmB [Limnohabitans sp. 2KL-1]|uniref:tRNA (guanosine(46)-N7)-methyltransferase TrmB n=1 Tax=Limnohabitans sp. 2KL-1 TaxID=1100699 RepID=UPI000D3D32AE|nr:tRNA (guanosine(46)-N7)-methyltransferase TrmB [Limnohabitans sp. 2KL-1]PUE47072.1 tRNA (guanosine(46)-N7)-methyltransferase TrmB [Limnohabitans sp. 2KL-1]